jgi:hypothetical protein
LAPKTPKTIRTGLEPAIFANLLTGKQRLAIRPPYPDLGIKSARGNNVSSILRYCGHGRKFQLFSIPALARRAIHVSEASLTSSSSSSSCAVRKREVSRSLDGFESRSIPGEIFKKVISMRTFRTSELRSSGATVSSDGLRRGKGLNECKLVGLDGLMRYSRYSIYSLHTSAY